MQEDTVLWAWRFRGVVHGGPARCSRPKVRQSLVAGGHDRENCALLARGRPRGEGPQGSESFLGVPPRPGSSSHAPPAIQTRKDQSGPSSHNQVPPPLPFPAAARAPRGTPGIHTVAGITPALPYQQKSRLRVTEEPRSHTLRPLDST